MVIPAFTFSKQFFPHPRYRRCLGHKSNNNNNSGECGLLPQHNEHRIRSRCSRCLTFCLVFTPAALCWWAKNNNNNNNIFQDKSVKPVPGCQNCGSYWSYGRRRWWREWQLLRRANAPVKSSPDFLQGGCPSCRPATSVRALKEYSITLHGLAHPRLTWGLPVVLATKGS